MAILARPVKRSVVLRKDDESKNREMLRGNKKEFKSLPKRMGGTGLNPSQISNRCATRSRTARAREAINLDRHFRLCVSGPYFRRLSN